MFVTNKVAKLQQVRKLRALIMEKWHEKDFDADKRCIGENNHVFVCMEKMLQVLGQSGTSPYLTCLVCPNLQSVSFDRSDETDIGFSDPEAEVSI